MRRFLSTLCSSCSRPLATRLPACNTCGSIAPIPVSIAFHDLFSLPAHPNPFVVNQALLKQRFREAQAACHPDSWAAAQKLQHKQDIAQGLSSRLNEAYNTLASPLRRAEYILEQNGMPISETDQLDDPRTHHGPEDAEALSRIMDENTAKITTTVEELERAVGRQEWMAVKTGAIRLRYLESIGSAARDKLD
ncbi:hypothetical protein C8F01DRAFT_1108759 [Mycena amicta]|nr:hypothetical protein C8F01DRAFT_1108759 [Mycena amicta]